MNDRERLGQKLIEPSADQTDDHLLRQGFSLDRFVRAAVLKSGVMLDDRGQAVFAHLISGERQPLPVEVRIAFKNAAGVVLDVAAGKIVVA